MNSIDTYLSSIPEPKRGEMQTLHRLLLEIMPGGRLWFSDGTDESGKVVSNPSIGYGQRTIRYADGKIKEFFQIGLSANTSGISVYIMGIEDKTYLPHTYGTTLGKASVTGYCIKFKTLKNINTDVLETAIRDGIQHTSDSAGA